MAKFSNTDLQNADAYNKAQPKQFGDLHERMKFLIECAMDLTNSDEGHKVWVAIHDLETEVMHHRPARPPYGRRSLRLA